LVVKFNKAVDANTLLESNGALKANTLAVTALTANDTSITLGTGKLSADGKELTVSVDTGYLNGDYTVTVSENVKDLGGKALTAYKQVLTFKDTVRPTVEGPVYVGNGVAKFTFSEPVNVVDDAALAAKLTLKDASGATYVPSVTLASDKKSFTLNISSLDKTKVYTLVAAGITDFAGNLLTPNPVSFTVENKVVDDVKPVATSASSSQAGYVTIKFSEKIAVGAGNVVATVNGISADLDTNASLDATGTELTVRDASFQGTLNVVVAGFADVAGNAGDSKTFLVTFPVDETKPTVKSAEVKTIDNKNYLVLTFSEDVTVTNTAANDITGTYVNQNGVEGTITPIDDTATSVSAVSGTKNQVKVLIDGQEKGNYTVTLPAGLVTDVVGNANDSVSVSYAVGNVASETVKPFITDSDSDPSNGYDGITVQSTDNNTITIKFSEKLPTSALNLGNFLIEGSQVFEKAVFTDTNQDTIKLTLKEGAIKTSGNYLLTVKDVADLNGNVMNTVNTTVSLTENDVPGLTSAVLASNDVVGGTAQIKLTFDEAIDSATIVDGEADFDVFIDGALITSATVAEDMGTTNNTVVLNINRALTATETTKTITIKPATDFDVADLAGNKLPKFTSVTVTK
jgi:hypothetical protein